MTNIIAIGKSEHVDVKLPAILKIEDYHDCYYDEKYGVIKVFPNTDDNLFKIFKSLDNALDDGKDKRLKVNHLIKSYNKNDKVIEYFNLKYKDCDVYDENKRLTREKTFKNKQIRFVVEIKQYLFNGNTGMSLKVVQIQTKDKQDKQISKCIFD